MAWNADELSNKYDEIYHVTSPENKNRILELGLVSCAETLRTVDDITNHINTGEDGLRSKQILVGTFGNQVLLNDQIPMLGVLSRCQLPDGMTPFDWAAYLDQHVFFWATKRRLAHFLYTRQKRDYRSVVFKVRTSDLLCSVRDVGISMQNSGGPYGPKPSPRLCFTALQAHGECSHWFGKGNKRKEVVEVVVRQHVKSNLLEEMQEGEINRLTEEAKLRARKKA